mmetsp:Transcript_31186/g.65756  ORF Transcript_31186/g.65756 Transcript_31186/m.65756 type:complete len:693 (-) Transcript_31186:15-2093(-)
MTLPCDIRSGCRIAILLHILVPWKMSTISALVTRGPSLPLHSFSYRASSSFAAQSRKQKARPRYYCRGAIGTTRLHPSVLHMSYSSSAASDSQSGKGFGKDINQSPKDSWKMVDVPLVFVPGMKGTHLAHESANQKPKTKKKRAWLTLGNLLNFPPRPDNDPSRDLSLPLTYDYDPPAKGEDGHEFASHYPRQHQGQLVPDGIVDHIVEVVLNAGNTTIDLDFLPFYGHTTRMLRDIDKEYHSRCKDGKVESTESFQKQDDGSALIGDKGIFDRAGSFVERTSNWAFSNKTNVTAQSHHSHKHCRPTAVFSYDWRRPLPELSTALHEFCENTFPDQPVQILAHSLGGLMAFTAMREHPEKYAPGAVVVGVPFETGIQYLQDLHKGYFTELDRCRQFTPDKQFSMSSHWSFFPITKARLEDRFVDVTEICEKGQEIKFDADKSGIGKKVELQPTVEGDNAWFEFYDPEEWERLHLGIFSPEYDDILTDSQRQDYKEHMRIQMAAAKKWRQTVLGEGESDDKDFNAKSFPPIVACASDAIPTVNQILRRKRKISPQDTAKRNPWEYDYVNGRSVPGDGRIDFDKAFPPSFVSHERIALNSAHAKQMCWEESGGSFGLIYGEVEEQANMYLKRLKEEEQSVDDAMEDVSGKSKGRRRSMINRIASRARNARKRLRRRRLLASRPKRFSFRRRTIG